MLFRITTFGRAARAPAGRTLTVVTSVVGAMERVALADREEVEAVDRVNLAQLAAGDELSVQHFRIEPGAVVPEHDHRHEQGGFVYRGELTFVLEDGTEVVVGEGDSYVLAGHEVHAAENRGDEPVEGVDVFSPPRTDPDWVE